MSTPFIIYALPRSRTAWLSKFLSYKDWNCYHEQAIYMTSLADVKTLLDCPNTGVAETAAAQGRYIIRSLFPDIKEVVILRPVDEVVESLMNVDLGEVAKYDREKLYKGMSYSDRVLRKIAKDPNVLVVNYADLDKEDVCASVFEHCLPYVFDKAWWESLRNKNVQIDVKRYVHYYHKYRNVIEAFKRQCKLELFRLRRSALVGA